jgi:hypothetical protein
LPLHRRVSSIHACYAAAHMNASLLDSFDVVVQADVVLARLRDAQQKVARKQSFDTEKQWLAVAIERLEPAAAGVGGLPARAARLPELEPVREELARTLQGAAVDAIERFQGAITFHAGPRAPVVEELFGALKLPALRKAKREEFEKFLGAFGRKLKSQYVKRILADADFAFALPAVEKLNQSFDAWRGAFDGGELSEADASALRDELVAAARTVDGPLRQARLLAEAALLSVDGAFEQSGIGAKPKKRKAAPTVETAESLAAEAAEVAAEVTPAVAAEPAVVEKVELPAKKAKGSKPGAERRVGH